MVIGTLAVGDIITTLIMIPISALFLMISTKIFKLKDQSFKTALKIVLIVFVINFVLGLIGIIFRRLVWITFLLNLLVYVILGIYLIKKYYNLDLSKSILVWLIWVILVIVAAIILALLMFLIEVTIVAIA